VIQTPYVKQIGTKASALARYLLRHRKTKEWMRLFYNLRALFNMKRSALRGLSTKDYWQAGKSVEHIHKIESVKDIVGTFRGQGGQVPG